MSKNERLFRIKYHGMSILAIGGNVIDDAVLKRIKRDGLDVVFECFKLQAECFADDFVLDSVEEIEKVMK